MEITTNYKNEGFLYIANKVEEESTSFIKGKGHIIDSDNDLICPGELPTLINPDYEDIKHQLSEIKYYTPLIRGTHIRIYWYNDDWNISTINEIYPTFDHKTATAINEQINTDLLDESQVYYATINTIDDKTTIILNYITEKNTPKKHIPQLEFDLAFIHHIPLVPFDDDLNLNLQHIMKTLKMEHEYGIILFKEDGTQIELWSKKYYIIKSMEKPDKICIYNYYFQCLNKYAVDETEVEDETETETEFEIIMNHLLCDINEFILYFPEYKKKCDSITQKIVEYIEANKCQSNKEKINKLNYLLSLDIENSISLISPMPSRRNSTI